MKSATNRVRISCPKCGDIIATAPENDLPDGDLVCSNCGAVVNAPSRLDMIVEEVKQAVTDFRGTPDGGDKRDS